MLDLAHHSINLSKKNMFTSTLQLNRIECTNKKPLRLIEMEILYTKCRYSLYRMFATVSEQNNIFDT